MLRRLFIALALLSVAAASGLASGWLLYEHTRVRELRGSAAVEFDAGANPADQRTAPPPVAAKRTPVPAKPKPKPAKPAKPSKPGRLAGVEWWPTYGYDRQRTRVSLSYGHRPPYRRAWTFRALHYLEFPPALAYGRVYIPQQKGRFFAVNASTGRILWKKHFKRCLAASPTVRNGVVYQAVMHPLPCAKWGRSSARGFMVAMDARTGKELWRFRTGVVESSPLYVDGILYFGSWDRHLYAVRARDGKLLWRYRADDEINSAPAFAGGTIYVGSDGGRLHAVWRGNGKERWVSSAFSRYGRREYFYATPTIAYGRVFIGNTDGTVYAFGAGSGRLLWARRVGTYVYTAAAVWRRKVFVGTYDGRVYALDAATGDQVWRQGAPAAVHGAPTVLDGLVYFASCGTCGRNGSRYAKRGPFSTFALDARNGKRVWSFPDGRYSPIVADPKRVYLVGSTRLYALVPKRLDRSPAARTKARTRPTKGQTR